jgi:hypothetical protein
VLHPRQSREVFHPFATKKRDDSVCLFACDQDSECVQGTHTLSFHNLLESTSPHFSRFFHFYYTSRVLHHIRPARPRFAHGAWTGRAVSPGTRALGAQLSDQMELQKEATTREGAFSNFGRSNDVIFAGLFVVHQGFLWTLVLLVTDDSSSFKSWHLRLLPILGAAALLATSVSLALLFLLVHYTGTMIKLLLVGKCSSLSCFLLANFESICFPPRR